MASENKIKRLTVGMLAHVDAGKTTLSEALLYHAGTIRRMGRVDHRDTFFDTRAAERERGITVFSKQAVLSLPGASVTLLDTPGHVDFSAETERTLSVLDYAVLVISGADGVQNHTETLWKLLERYRIPVFLFVNKMDRPGTDEQSLLSELKTKLSDGITNMRNPDYEDICLIDESLLAEYLETGNVRDTHFPRLIKERRMFPCYFGSALKDEGVSELINGLLGLCEAPAYGDSFGAKVYKITFDPDGTRLIHLKLTGGTLSAKQTVPGFGKVDRIRVYQGERFESVQTVTAGEVCAVTGAVDAMAGDVFGTESSKNRAVLEPILTYRVIPGNMDTVKLLPLIKRLEEEDPTLRVIFEENSKEIRIQVMGPVQLDILSGELKERFGAEVTFDTGSVVYRETIARPVEGVGHFEPLRHYAEVHIFMEPLPTGSGLIFGTELSEDLLAGNWQRLILTHLKEKRHRGVLTGSLLTDVKLTLIDGKAHPKHTEGGDFRQATYRAVRQGLMETESVLLEPVFTFQLSCPSDCLGRVMYALNERFAEFTQDEALPDGSPVLTGTAPVSVFRDMPAELPALTRGLGRITYRPAGYRPCHNTAEVISAIGYDPEADLANPCGSVFCTHGSGFQVPWYDVPNYMHLPYVTGVSHNDTEEKSLSSASEHSIMEALDLSLGTEEIDSILHKAGRANARPARKTPVKAKPLKPYRGTEQKQNKGPVWVLVDGYNIIHAWTELNSLASLNLDSARGRLLDILCNYAAYSGCELIAVFDAYRVSGHTEETADYHNIHVVFTKEAETADSYIERFTHLHASDYRIRVATSDGLEQSIIRGAGSLVVSAREFLEEVRTAESSIREHL